MRKKNLKNNVDNQNNANEDLILNYAISLFNNNELDKPKEICESLLISNPNNAICIDLLILIYLKENQIEKSIQLMNQIMSIFPQNGNLYFKYGYLLHNSRSFQKAIEFYKKAFENKCNNSGIFLNIGVSYQELSNNNKAIEFFKLHIENEKENLEIAFLNIAISYKQLAKYDESLLNFDFAVKVNSNFIPAYFNKGCLLLKLKRFDEAIYCFNKILTLDGAHFESYIQLALLYEETKKQDEARNIYEKGLVKCEKKSEIYNAFGEFFYRNGENLKSIDLIKKAIECNENITKAKYYYNLGLIYQELGDINESLANYNNAININNNYYEAHSNKGVLLQDLKQYDAAMESYNKAINNSNPNLEIAYSNRGTLKHIINNLDGALKDFQNALNINSNYYDALVNLGNAYLEKGDYDSSFYNYEKALKIHSDKNYLYGTYTFNKLKNCNWDNFENITASILTNLNEDKCISRPFELQMILNDNKLMHKITNLYSKEIENKFIKVDRYIKKINKKKNTKIKIAYLSVDFGNHPVTYYTQEIFKKHDKSRFEIIAISLKNNNKYINKNNLEILFDDYFSIENISISDSIKLCRSLNIDIAIDLSGHTKGNYCHEIFYNRIAQIQISYIGYLSTMGSNCYDYIFTDHVLSEQCDEKFYNEKLLYLDSYYLGLDSSFHPSSLIYDRKILNIKNDTFIFCSFNGCHKLNPSIFKNWLDILKNTKNSVLLIFVDDLTARKNLIKNSVELGIEKERIIFADKLSREDNIQRMSMCNLFLDTFPYNGGATILDSVKANLPVLTLKGNTPSSRAGASILNALNMKELITKNHEEYVNTAIEIANNKYFEVKERFVKNIHNSLLNDSVRFMYTYENLIHHIYDKHNL